MTPEQIAASLRSIPYGVGNKAADLIEQQVSELEALRAERDAASERRKAEVISLQKACRALKTQVKGLNRKLVKVQGAEGNFSERADMMLRIEYQRKELTTLRTYAARYQWLRNRDLDAISSGGVFAGLTPDNVVLNGDDLDATIDAALAKIGGAA